MPALQEKKVENLESLAEYIREKTGFFVKKVESGRSEEKALEVVSGNKSTYVREHRGIGMVIFYAENTINGLKMFPMSDVFKIEIV